MVTLQELKDRYAQEEYFDDWFSLELEYSKAGRDTLSRHWESVCLLAQQEALKNAAESAKVKVENVDAFGVDEYVYLINKDSITSETNLIK